MKLNKLKKRRRSARRSNIIKSTLPTGIPKRLSDKKTIIKLNKLKKIRKARKTSNNTRSQGSSQPRPLLYVDCPDGGYVNLWGHDYHIASTVYLNLSDILCPLSLFA